MAKAAKSAALKKDVVAPAASSQTATITHNSVDPAREKVFIAGFAQVKAEEVAMAGHKGTLAQIYKRMETAGFTKDHIAFAKTLEKKNVAEVIADFKAKIEICMIMGHQAGRQLDMLDKDRTPIEDQAYLDGLAAGKLGRAAANPYGMETIAGQRFQEGLNQGNVIRNAALNEAINGDNLIKGAADDEDGSEGGAEEGDHSGADQEDSETESSLGVPGEGGAGTVGGSDETVSAAGSEASDNDDDGADEGADVAVAETAAAQDDDDDWNDADPNK